MKTIQAPVNIEKKRHSIAVKHMKLKLDNFNQKYEFES